jgi:predicted MFS family arabinose efflux permease
MMSISRKSALFIWIIASIFYAYQYILRVMPNIMLNELLEQFNINAAIFGQFSGIYYIGYSFMHMPIGIMLDRFGPKKVLPVCMFLTSIGLLPIIMAENWIYPLFGRLLIGIGSSAAILGTFKIVRIGFKEEHFTRMLSIAVTIGLIGAIYGGGPVAYMNQAIGHQALVQIFVLAGIVLGVISYIAIPEIPPTPSDSVLKDLKIVFTNKKVVMLCLFAGLMVGPLEGFADVWGAEFLKQIYGYDATTASYLTSLIFVGMCFGAPVISFIAEKTNAYLGAITGAAITMFLIFTSLLTELLDMSGISIGFTIIGVCCAYQILAIYKASTYVPEHASSLTTAVANMIIMSFGYGFHTAIGLIVSSYASEGSIAYIYGIGVIPICLSLGGIGCLFISLHDRALAKKERMAELV